MLSIMARLDNHKTTLEELLERVSVLENFRHNTEEKIDGPHDTVAEQPEQPTTGMDRGF